MLSYTEIKQSITREEALNAAKQQKPNRYWLAINGKIKLSNFIRHWRENVALDRFVKANNATCQNCASCKNSICDFHSDFYGNVHINDNSKPCKAWTALETRHET